MYACMQILLMPNFQVYRHIQVIPEVMGISSARWPAPFPPHEIYESSQPMEQWIYAKRPATMVPEHSDVLSPCLEREPVDGLSSHLITAVCLSLQHRHRGTFAPSPAQTPAAVGDVA